MSDDMPGLEEAVAIILEEIEDGGAADSLIAEIAGKKAYRIIAKAVREQTLNRIAKLYKKHGFKPTHMAEIRRVFQDDN